MRSPIRWYGGKGQMLGKLLPLLPPHQTYVEPFAGGAALFFAKPPAPVEVLNDVDSGLVNFYRVLRNPAMFAEFARRVELTPYSRTEWRECLATWQDIDEPIERAARWFVAIRQNMMGGSSGAGWSYSITETSRGRALSVSNWLSAVQGLAEVHARLSDAQLECQDWRGVLAAYDTADTLFYCDPPYIHETRSDRRYRNELTAEDHTALVERLLTVKGLAILSGYAHPLYRPLEHAGWQRIDVATAAHTVQTRGTGAGLDQAARVETIWLNPACQAARMGPLFAGVA